VSLSLVVGCLEGGDTYRSSNSARLPELLHSVRLKSMRSSLGVEDPADDTDGSGALNSVAQYTDRVFGRDT
jgi:hypothetical protein